jgi:hypothetical protein
MSWRGWKDNIKKELKEKGGDGVDWIDLAYEWEIGGSL